MALLSSNERAVVERAGAEHMLDQVLSWTAINSGSRNLAGLERMADLLVDAFAALPGLLRLENPAEVKAVELDGSFGQHQTRTPPSSNGPPDSSGAVAADRPHGHGLCG